jgi:hypothetical protein
MADIKDVQEIWLPVIGNALAFLCLDKFSEKQPDKTDSVLKKVRFLEGLGLPEQHAAGAAGSTPESVKKLKQQERKRGK